MGRNNANIQDIGLLIQAGINPVTGLPLKMGGSCMLANNIKKQLRILDEQDALNRYRWHNLPDGITGLDLERILYYRSQAIFFYDNVTNKFYFLPYCPVGKVDCYGRFNFATPLPFGGGTTADANINEGKIDNNKALSEAKKTHPELTQKRLKIYRNPNEMNDSNLYDWQINGCVVLYDYSRQMSEQNISRQILQDPLLGVMSEIIPYCRTSLIINSGAKAFRIPDGDAKGEVINLNKQIVDAALEGHPFIPATGRLEWQDLAKDSTPLRGEDFLVVLQGLDNFRLSMYGLKNGGVFLKKAHMLGDEQQMNDGNTYRIYQDGLTLRQNFCDLVNQLYRLGIWCESSETVSGVDKDMDGEVNDQTEQSGIPGEQSPEEVTNEN